MNNIIFLRAVASPFLTLTQITHWKNEQQAPKALHQLFFMNEIFRWQEIVSSINIYALPKARFVLSLPSSKWGKGKIYIAQTLSMSYWNWNIVVRLQINEINWKLKKLFPKTNFVMHGISLSLTMLSNSATECAHKIADISFLQSVENTNIFYTAKKLLVCGNEKRNANNKLIKFP